jgi:hypothetical protein
VFPNKDYKCLIKILADFTSADGWGRESPYPCSRGIRQMNAQARYFGGPQGVSYDIAG